MVPYAVIALVLGLNTIYFQTHRGELHPIVLGGLATRLIGAGCALCFYLGKFIMPLGLLPVYPPGTFASPSLLQLLSLPAMAALFLRLGRRERAGGAMR